MPRRGDVVAWVDLRGTVEHGVIVAGSGDPDVHCLVFDVNERSGRYYPHQLALPDEERDGRILLTKAQAAVVRRVLPPERLRSLLRKRAQYRAMTGAVWEESHYTGKTVLVRRVEAPPASGLGAPRSYEPPMKLTVWGSSDWSRLFDWYLTQGDSLEEGKPDRVSFERQPHWKRMRQLKAMRRQCTPHQYDVLLLAIYAEMSPADIGALLGISERTAQHHAQRGMERLTGTVSGGAAA